MHSSTIWTNKPKENVHLCTGQLLRKKIHVIGVLLWYGGQLVLIDQELNPSNILGHSGVGKSSLINSLDSNLNLRTSIVSEQNEQGQHTTTFAEMFDLIDGAKIIDSPGIKGFGLIDIDRNEIGGYFNEIAKLSHNCKFNNCLHYNEPNCAIKEAVDNNDISEFRYNNYLSLLNSDDSNFRVDNYK